MTHSSLSIHRRIHTGDNLHHCKLCDNWFSFQINLIQLPFIYACILLEGKFVIVPIHNLYPFQFSCVFWWCSHSYWNQWRWTNNWLDVLYSHATHFHILSHIWPSVPRFEHVGFHVILNAGTRRHGHQLKQSVKLGRALDLSVTQCTIAQTWDSAKKQCPVMVIVQYNTLNF